MVNGSDPDIENGFGATVLPMAIRAEECDAAPMLTGYVPPLIPFIVLEHLGRVFRMNVKRPMRAIK